MITITLRFGAADLRRCRFAVSPAFETLSAIRVVTGPQPPGPHQRWLESVRDPASTLDLRPITLLQPRRGYTPDFLAPPPPGPSSDIGEELARIAATPLEQVREEINRSLADTPGAADTETGRKLRGDTAAVLAMLTELIDRAWQALVAPVWTRVRGLIDADIGFQSRRLAEGGLDELFAALHPALHWHDNVLSRAHDDDHRDLNGAGVLLMPSVFKWDQVVIVLDQPWQPAVVYPARGLGALWQPADGSRASAMTRLIGRTRALLLCGLDMPASTTWLAHRYALAPATVSQHLSTLKEAGWVVGERHRHEIRYRRTPLGEKVCG